MVGRLTNATAIVWLDIGKDLTQGPWGPWMVTRYGHGPKRNRATFPVMQHHHKMTLRQGAIESILASEKVPPTGLYSEGTKMPQSAALLPFEFEKLLDTRIANCDAFYAVHHIFQHVAFAEVQVLNLLEEKIEDEMGVLIVERDQSHSIENLQFFSVFLDHHLHQISDTLRIVKRKGHPTWPSQTGRCEPASSAASVLVEDFESLLARALDLRKRCTEGMGVMMNRAVVAESRKAIEQAERLKRLTLLASFFIPLSFTTSLFGMNFKEFGQGHLSAWLFAVVSIPVLVVSYFAYAWEDSFKPVYVKCKIWAGRHFARRKLNPHQAA